MNQQPPQIHTVSFNDEEFQHHVSLYDRAVEAGRLQAALQAAISSSSPELLVASRLLQKFEHQPVANPGEKDGGNVTTKPTLPS